MCLSRRGCLLREDGLSKLGLRSTSQCRRISLFPMAPRYLRDMCPKVSWKPMNREKMCVIKVLPSWPPCEAFEQNWWSLVITEVWYCEFKLTLTKKVLIEKGIVFFYPPAQLASLELWSGWFQKNNFAFTQNHCFPDAMFGTFIQSLDYFMPNSVSRVKTDSLQAKGVCECVYFFWKCLRFNQFLWMFP